MDNILYLSIKPQYVNQIVEGTKKYEYRSYNPKRKVDYLFVYTTLPVGELKYVLKVGKPIKDKLYAFPIEKVIGLKKPLSLKQLKGEYNFNPPQGYVYSDKYEKLTNYIKEQCNNEKV